MDRAQLASEGTRQEGLAARLEEFEPEAVDQHEHEVLAGADPLGEGARTR